jgi:hypothetical protein
VEISITVAEDEKYIIIKGKGEIRSGDPKVLIEPLIEAHEFAKKLGINKILVDVTEAWNALRISDTYEIVNHKIPQESAIDRYIQVALLVSPDDHSHDFTETVARNAGFNFTLYRDRAQALAALMRD